MNEIAYRRVKKKNTFSFIPAAHPSVSMAEYSSRTRSGIDAGWFVVAGHCAVFNLFSLRTVGDVL